MTNAKNHIPTIKESYERTKLNIIGDNMSKFKFLRKEDEYQDYSDERAIFKEIAYQLKRLADNNERTSKNKRRTD